MKVTALAGGVGAARFLRGVVEVVPAQDLTVIVNTGDDLTLHGLHISPDLDSVTYTLGGGAHPEQGWGRADESYVVTEELASRYGRSRWFSLGDRDLATHLVRSEILAAGGTLSDATRQIAESWKLPFALLPMTDARVATRIVTSDGRDLHFQEWWVGEHAEPPVASVRLAGGGTAIPAPGVLEAIAEADAVLLCPSNPVVSVGPILTIAGIRDALRSAPVAGVSPIVGGAVVRGMADRLMPAAGMEVSALGTARAYADFLDGWVIDEADRALAPAIADLGIDVAVTDTIMRDVAVTARLARTALSLLEP